MSTSDQQGHGPLTRKQLREIRLTGSTQIITDAEASAAASASPPVPPLPRPAEPFEAAIAPPQTPTDSSAPLTRRRVREMERTKTGSMAIVDDSAADAQPIAEEKPADEKRAEEQASADAPAESGLVTELPAFEAPTPAADLDDVDDDLGDEVVAAPVSAARNDQASDVTVLPEAADLDADADDAGSDEAESDDPVAAVAALGIDVPVVDEDDDVDPDDVLADVHEADDSDVVADARPTVSSTFGEGLLADAAPQKPFVPSFDELLTVGDSGGSQHTAPNSLIFTPSPGDGSLSGPVAATGEILVTGSYELPQGLGSQGHAHGTTDGKELDVVLIDGELPPASSPTPIAASAAISTIKPAGEVIRPPAPEKGNKLMLTLAIVAGGLALALGVALIVAFTTNVF